MSIRMILLRADGLMRQGNYRNAVNVLEVGIQDNINYPYIETPYNLLGTCYLKLHEFDKAESAYKNAIAATPRFLDAHCNLGNVYAIQNMLAEAFDKYMYVLTQNKTHKYAQQGVGLFLKKIDTSGEWDVLLKMGQKKQLEFLSILSEENKSLFMEIWLKRKLKKGQIFPI